MWPLLCCVKSSCALLACVATASADAVRPSHGLAPWRAKSVCPRCPLLLELRLDGHWADAACRRLARHRNAGTQCRVSGLIRPRRCLGGLPTHAALAVPRSTLAAASAANNGSPMAPPQQQWPRGHVTACQRGGQPNAAGSSKPRVSRAQPGGCRHSSSHSQRPPEVRFRSVTYMVLATGSVAYMVLATGSVTYMLHASSHP